MVWTYEINGRDEHIKKDIRITIYGHLWDGLNNMVQPDTAVIKMKDLAGNSGLEML
jgi:hypothetical protein